MKRSRWSVRKMRATLMLAVSLISLLLSACPAPACPLQGRAFVIAESVALRNASGAELTTVGFLSPIELTGRVSNRGLATQSGGYVEMAEVSVAPRDWSLREFGDPSISLCAPPGQITAILGPPEDLSSYAEGTGPTYYQYKYFTDTLSLWAECYPPNRPLPDFGWPEVPFLLVEGSGDVYAEILDPPTRRPLYRMRRYFSNTTCDISVLGTASNRRESLILLLSFRADATGDFSLPVQPPVYRP